MDVFGLGRTTRLVKSHLFRFKARDSAVPIAFLHVPKTAGSALTEAFVQSVIPEAEFDWWMDRSIFGSFTAFDTLAWEFRRRCILDNNDLARLPKKLEFISGHVSLSTFRKTYGNAQYVTALREPISRIFSHWLYWRSFTDESLPAWGKWGDLVLRSRSSLLSFVSSRDLACQIDNLVVRMLLWPHKLIPDDDFIDERNDRILLREAIRRLNEFSFVDIIENPDFRSNLEAWLGTSVNYANINQTVRMAPSLRTTLHDELDSKTFATLESLSRLDLKLWTAVTEERIRSVDVSSFRRRCLMLNAARHSLLMV